MIHDNDTLDFYKSLPLFRAGKTGHTCPEMASVLNKFMGEFHDSSLKNPDEEALEFYLYNHVWAEVLKNTPAVLTEDQRKLADLYLQKANMGFMRMACYMVLIVTRESRHTGMSVTFTKKVEEKFGSVFLNFLQSIHGSGSSGAANAFRKSPPNMPLDKYLEAISYVFYHGQFGGGYGGKKWGAIADVVHSCFAGLTSPEIMLDTSFTLCHNNGPIFNKGMIYSGYSSYFIKHLDVQRSGQIPAYLKEVGAHYPTLKQEVLELEAKLGYSLGDYVDWYKVEALGSVNKYPKEKKAQVVLHGMPEHVEAEEKAALLKEKSRYYIDANNFATIYQRKAA